jgi:hypothetical protein
MYRKNTYVSFLQFIQLKRWMLHELHVWKGKAVGNATLPPTPRFWTGFFEARDAGNEKEDPLRIFADGRGKNPFN